MKDGFASIEFELQIEHWYVWIIFIPSIKILFLQTTFVVKWSVKTFWSKQHVHILIYIQDRLHFHHFKLLVLVWEWNAVSNEYSSRVNLSIIFLIWSKITIKQEHNFYPKSLLLFRLSVENHHMARASISVYVHFRVQRNTVPTC